MEKTERHLKLRQVALFIEAAEHGKAEAARARGVTPSALVQALADLESTLGDVALFDRSQRGVLTPAGEAFLVQAKRLLHDEEAARRAILRIVKNQNDAPLRIAYTPEFAWTVARLLKHLLEGGRRVESIEADVEAVLSSVATLSVDMALVPGKHPGPPKQMKHIYSHGPEVRFLSKDQRFVIDGKFVSLESIANEAFAFPWSENETPPAQRAARATVERYFTRHGFVPARIAYCGDSRASMLEAVATGEVVSIYPIAEASGIGGGSVSLPSPKPLMNGQNIYYRNSEPVMSVAKLFSSHLRLQLDEEPAKGLSVNPKRTV